MSDFYFIESPKSFYPKVPPQTDSTFFNHPTYFVLSQIQLQVSATTIRGFIPFKHIDMKGSSGQFTILNFIIDELRLM